MTKHIADILEQIAESLDPEDILYRLNLNSYHVVEAFSELIAQNLQVFDDVYFEDSDDEEEDEDIPEIY